MSDRTLLLDSNLLVLLVVGLASPSYVRVHKKLTAFDVSDFELLEQLLTRASEVLVTPNTLTETSNLLAYIAEPARTSIMRTFAAIIGRTREIFVDSATAVRRTEFVRIGLTDSAMLHAARDDFVVLTTDLDLYLAASAQIGERAVNFNHVRDARR